MDEDSKRFDNIIKSPQDKREYRGLILKNELKVMLISDPSTDESAAAMKVSVGDMSDPDEIPGLANLCEHMLFLETEKYPNENDFSNYLGENGGSSNAETGTDSTTYYFDINSDKFEPALDRFANFFICPLFTEAATHREMNAVDSEHENNLAVDIWRISQVYKTLSIPQHPFNKFGTGNLKTLIDDPQANEIDVRSELIKFYGEWYSANIMSLVVFGKETLDDLEEMVVSKFSSIENKNVISPSWTEHPFQSDSTKTFIVPVSESNLLILKFPTADLDHFYKSVPEQYLSHLIQQEGNGSIISELKAKGWCNYLKATQRTSARGFGFFDIIADLTNDGIDNVDKIIKIIFQYLNMLKEIGPQQHLFEEYCSVNELWFRFQEEEIPLSLVTEVVNSMRIHPLEEVLSGPYVKSEWKPDLITDLLDNLIPESVRVIIVAQKHEPICEDIEIWYGTKYHTEKIEEDIIENWKDCGLNENLHLPEPNLFIPTNFDLIPIESCEVEHPIIIHDTPTIRVWLKQDTEFLTPITLMNYDFSNPIVYSDPLSCVLVELFVQLLGEQLNEDFGPAALTNLRFNVLNSQYGIRLSINGYSHKQKIFLEKILDQIFVFEVKSDRFDVLKVELQKTISNYKTNAPDARVSYFGSIILAEIAWTNEEMLDSFSLVTVDRLESFIKQFLARMHVECLIYGNANKEIALEMTNLIEEKLILTDSGALPLFSSQLLLLREIKLPKRESYLFEAENEFHKSSCVQLYLQCGMQDDHANVFIDLTAHIFNEPCYTVLRTKEQLGHIVSSGARKMNGVQGINFLVQSNRHPIFVEERIEAFIESMESVFDKMSDDEFEVYKEALVTLKLEKPKNLSTQFKKFLREITLQQFHFDRANVEVEFLRTLTKEQFIDYYNTFIKRGGSARRALFIYVLSTAEGGAGHVDNVDVKPDKISSHIPIKDLSVFKSTRELYSLVRPYMNIEPKGGKSEL